LVLPDSTVVPGVADRAEVVLGAADMLVLVAPGKAAEELRERLQQQRLLRRMGRTVCHPPPVLHILNKMP